MIPWMLVALFAQAAPIAVTGTTRPPGVLFFCVPPGATFITQCVLNSPNLTFVSSGAYTTITPITSLPPACNLNGTKTTACMHNMSTAPVSWTCYDAKGNWILPLSATLGNNFIIFSFSGPQSGSCKIL